MASDDVTDWSDRCPPFLIPFCATCKMSVEQFTFHPMRADMKIPVECNCHGKTSGFFLTPEDLVKRQVTGAKVVVFQAHQGFDRVE